MKRRLRLARNKMHALKDKQGNIINNFNDVVRVADFMLNCIDGKCHPSSRGSDEHDTEVPYVTTDEVSEATRDMPCGKVVG